MDETVKRFFGGLLMAVGALIGGLGGLCTLGFVGTIIVAQTSGGDHFDAALTALLCCAVGAIPMGIGAGLFFLGRSLRPAAGPRKV